ncbi:MAG: hypothetical protein OEX04_19675, partial [Acidimicrobiia bacterium]|nr:hypothetical protein [Acidimicrobiia bacterium]
ADATDGTLLMQFGAERVFVDFAGGIVYQAADVVYRHDAAGEDTALAPAGGPGTLQSLLNTVAIDGGRYAIIAETPPVEDVQTQQGIVYEVNLDTLESRELIRFDDFEGGMDTISWDGTRYVVGSHAEASTTVYLLDRDGNRTEWTGALKANCTDDTTCATFPVASPDGRMLYYIAVKDGERQLIGWDRTTDAEVWSAAAPGIVAAATLHNDVIVVNRWEDGFTALVEPLFFDIANADPELDNALTTSQGAVAGWGFVATNQAD